LLHHYPTGVEQARIFHELTSRDSEDALATGQPQELGSEAYLNSTSQGLRSEDAREEDHIRCRSRPFMKYTGLLCYFTSRFARLWRSPSILFALAALPSSLKLRRDKPLSPAPHRKRYLRQAASATSGFPVSSRSLRSAQSRKRVPSFAVAVTPGRD
jgi:hypothetical protein